MIICEVYKFTEQDRINEREADIDSGHYKSEYYKPFMRSQVIEQYFHLFSLSALHVNFHTSYSEMTERQVHPQELHTCLSRLRY